MTTQNHKKLALLAFLAGAAAGAQAAEETDPENWAVHGQLTYVAQQHDHFTSPYQGQNSLEARGRGEETTDVTLYAGLRLGANTELWINPEIDQGAGLSNTIGLAGFSSGEAYKIGSNHPYLRLPRAFVRHVIPLGQETEAVEAAANQLGGSRTHDNVTITAGKMSVTDIFDTNSYAHDPRGDFLNWALIDAGAFDYAADAWGFTYGAAVEWTQGDWTARAGVYQLSPEPNGKIVKPDFSQYMLVAELEQRYQWSGHPGKIKLLGFANRGRMARYDDAVALGIAQQAAPDVTLVRRKAWRPGATVNLEQEVAADLGVFLRAGFNDGSKETYEFTEINRALSGGLSLKGARWGRPDDTVGVAGIFNTISGDARNYFAHGGLGLLIGDGTLDYGAEKILEAYYSAKLCKSASLAFDVQRVNNPAYNRARGPVSIYALRLHAEF